MAHIESGIIPVPEGRNPINFLWELRDRVYRNVNQKPYQEEHYCYVHEQARIENPKSGNWAHRLVGNEWCVERQDAGTATTEAGADAEATEGPERA